MATTDTAGEDAVVAVNLFCGGGGLSTALVKHLLLPTDQPTVSQYEKPKTLDDGGEADD